MLEAVAIRKDQLKGVGTYMFIGRNCFYVKKCGFWKGIYNNKKKHTDAHLGKYLTLFHHGIIVFLGKATSVGAQDCNVLQTQVLSDTLGLGATF